MGVEEKLDIPLENILGIFAQTGGELALEKSANGGVPLRWREHRLYPATISLSSDVILPSPAPVKRSRAVRSGAGHPPLPRSNAGELRPSAARPLLEDLLRDAAPGAAPEPFKIIPSVQNYKSL